MDKRIQRVTVLVLTSIIILASFLTLSNLNFTTAREEAFNEIQNSALPLTRENIYSEILKDLVPAINLSSFMSNDLFLKNWIIGGEKNPEDIIKYLDNIHEKYGYFSVFFISGISSAYYHYSGVLKQISTHDPHDVWYYNFINSGMEYDLDVDTNEAAENILTIFINFRMEDDDGNLLGVTGVGLKMENYTNVIEEIQARFQRRVFLVDSNGVIQAHSKGRLIENTDIRNMPGISEISSAILSAKDTPADFEYNLDNKRTLVTARYIPEISWFLIVEQDENSALASARSSKMRTNILGILITIFTIIIIILLQRSYQKRIEVLAESDPLTGIANRMNFNEHFSRAAYRFSRFGTDFSVIMIDIDNFKKINDSYGHLAGDETIIKISELIAGNIRIIDFLARWGGDEFTIIVEGTIDQAEEIMKRIIEQLPLIQLKTEKAEIRPTLSCGIIQYGADETREQIIKKADMLMYKAKKQGKNRIVTG